MEQQRRHAPPPARSAALVPLATPAPASQPPPDRTRWTPAKQRAFLDALLDSGSVTRAAKVAGMSRSSAQRLRQRLAGTPFDRLWDRVLALHAARMADPFSNDAAPAGARPARC